MNDILVIIPLHKFDDEVKSLLNDAVNSVPNDIDIVISTQKDITEKIAECFKENPNVKAIGNDASDFQTLVNNAVNDDYKWFSILEYDDEYTPIWFQNVRKYIEFKPSTSIFLPLEDLVDFNKKEYQACTALSLTPTERLTLYLAITNSFSESGYSGLDA